jgi:hypothetical protein
LAGDGAPAGPAGLTGHPIGQERLNCRWGRLTYGAMGLAVSVGIMAEMLSIGEDEGVAHFRADFDRLSAALAADGVDWREPESADVPPMRQHAGSFPYSYLHYLRRTFALLQRGEPVTPVASPDELDRDEHKVSDETTMMSSHLLCHSDCEGYYVPVDFPEPLFLPEDAGIEGGGMVGSSQGLRAELVRCAPALGIRLDDGSLPDEEAARLYDIPDEADFGIETVVWLTLYEATRVSIARGHAIVFG